MSEGRLLRSVESVSGSGSLVTLEVFSDGHFSALGRFGVTCKLDYNQALGLASALLQYATNLPEEKRK